MTTPADVTVSHRDERVIAHLAGEIDASNVAWIGGRLRAELSNRSDALVADLSAVSYIDSAGIALLFELAEELRTHRQHLELVIPQGSPIARMAMLTGLSGAVPTHSSVEALTADEP